MLKLKLLMSILSKVLHINCHKLHKFIKFWTSLRCSLILLALYKALICHIDYIAWQHHIIILISHIQRKISINRILLFKLVVKECITVAVKEAKQNSGDEIRIFVWQSDVVFSAESTHIASRQKLQGKWIFNVIYLVNGL